MIVTLACSATLMSSISPGNCSVTLHTNWYCPGLCSTVTSWLVLVKAFRLLLVILTVPPLSLRSVGGPPATIRDQWKVFGTVIESCTVAVQRSVMVSEARASTDDGSTRTSNGGTACKSKSTH